MKSTVSERGQVVIPKPLRVRLGIRTGQVLDFREERGRMVVSKSEEKDPLDGLVGILKSSRSTDSWVRELRGEADAVEKP